MFGDVTGLELGVSEFVALLNQTLDYAYPDLTITGELANLRVSKNRWVYFDLKDDNASVKFFGTVYMLPGPLEDGMLLKVRGQPRLHNLYGFSVNVQSMQPAGEGTIKRAQQLLQAQLQKEGLFDEDRKRRLPYPPQRIGLVASKQSAAYADFIKVLAARWGGVQISHIDVQVQGEIAPKQIVEALAQFNALAEPPEVLVVIRGGGSAEDLAAFSTEQVTRAVAASRVPTLVAIGHEIDVSLAELAADQRASTPSNAAELLVPDSRAVSQRLSSLHSELDRLGREHLHDAKTSIADQATELQVAIDDFLQVTRQGIDTHQTLLKALGPDGVLRRGYAIVRHEGKAVRSGKQLKTGTKVDITLADGTITANLTKERP